MKLSRGIVYALVAAGISGISFWYAKYSVMKIDPVVLTTGRNMVAGLLFLALFTLESARTRRDQKPFTLHPKLFLVSLLGGSVPFLLFFTGLSQAGAVQANVVHKTMFIWASGLAALLLKERMPGYTAVLYISVLIVSLFLIPVSFSTGIVLVSVATLLWSVEQVLVKTLSSNNSPARIGVARMLGGAIVLTAVTVINGKAGLLLSLSAQQYTAIAIGGSLLFGYVYYWLRAVSALPVYLTTGVLTIAAPVGIGIQYALMGGSTIVPSDLRFSVLILGMITLFVLIRTVRLKRTP